MAKTDFKSVDEYIAAQPNEVQPILEGNQDIYLVSVTGGEPRHLTADSAAEFHPAFSPDGRSIVFHSAKHRTRDIFLIGVNGGNPRRLTDQPGEEFQPADERLASVAWPTFSPDG